MHNSLFPGFVKLFYTVGTKEHVATLPAKPFFAVSSTWYVEAKGDPTGILWTTALTAYITVIKPFFHTSVTFTYAELWNMSAPDADPVYQDNVNLAIAGTSAIAVIPMSQTVFSGRTQDGGVAKLYLMETSQAVNTKTKPVYTGAILAVQTYMLGNTSWIVGRNGGFWVAMPQVTTKTNDTLRRQAGLE